MKIYNKSVTEVPRLRRGLEPCDTSEDADIMSMDKKTHLTIIACDADYLADTDMRY